MKDHPEVLAKKLTELEKSEADKQITTEELKETLDNSNAGKPQVRKKIETKIILWRKYNLSTVGNVSARLFR